VCRHCGNYFPAYNLYEKFCSRGCRRVAKAIETKNAGYGPWRAYEKDNRTDKESREKDL